MRVSVLIGRSYSATIDKAHNLRVMFKIDERPPILNAAQPKVKSQSSSWRVR